MRQGVVKLPAVGRGHHRIAGAGKECPDPVVSGGGNLLRQRGNRQFPVELRQAPDAAAVAADSGRLGNQIVYLTNSAGGLRSMVTTSKATKRNIAGIVTYESIGYVFPIGHPESPPNLCDMSGAACAFGPLGIPLEDFKKEVPAESNEQKM